MIEGERWFHTDNLKNRSYHYNICHVMRYKTESITVLLGLRETERAGRRHLYVRGK